MRRLSAIPKLLGWLVLAGAALALSAWWHAGLPIARSAARDALNQVASQAMRGALVVGRFDELDDKHIVARHVALFDPDGRRVIVANRLELTPDGSLIAQLWRDSTHVRFRDARLSGGTVHLVDAGDGLPTLFQSFDSPTPSSTPSASSEAVHVDITKVELNDVTLYGDLLGLQNLRAEHVTAHGAMEIGSDVNVTVHDAHGNLTEPFGFVAGIDELAGTISTRPEVGVTLHARAHRDSEQASMQLELKSPTPTEPQVLDLRLDAQPISSDTLSRMHFTWAEPLAGMYRGQIRLHGPTSALQLDGSVTGDAGNVQVHGSIADADGVKVHLASDDIMLAKLVASAPNLSVKGAMDLTIPKPNTPPQLHLELAALRYKGIAVPAVQVEGVIESDHLRIVEARTTAKGARLRAKGNVGWNGSADLNVDAFFPAIERDPNLSRMADNVHGSLTASVRIRTPNDNRGFLDMNGRVVLAHFVYGSISADRVTLTGSAKGDPSLPTLRLTVLAENTSVLAYSLGTARFALNGGPRGYQAEGEFQAKAQRTFYFNAKILADRKGFTAQADPIEFAVGDNTWRGVARDIVVVHGDRVELGLLRLASRSQRLEAHSVIHVHGEDYASAQLQDFDLAAVHALLGKRFPFDQGRADATVEVHGDVTRPELVLQGAMRGGKALDIEGIDALYSINYKDG
ncbi:MAG TPA: hypothetical protein VHM19_09170, partial [Polyangiales bacterium]|nr:hypothetical protein [Polyangiales bacterium]